VQDVRHVGDVTLAAADIRDLPRRVAFILKMSLRGDCPDALEFVLSRLRTSVERPATRRRARVQPVDVVAWVPTRVEDLVVEFQDDAAVLAPLYRVSRKILQTGRGKWSVWRDLDQNLWVKR